MEETEYQKKVEKLKLENEDLKTKLIDLTFESNYSIEKELAEFVRTLYREVNDELKNKTSELTKKEILNNIKNYIIEFSKNYKFKI